MAVRHLRQRPLYKLHNPKAKVKVEAIDGFGNTYTQTEFVEDLTTAAGY